MTIGLKRGTVQIQPYDPDWAVAFEKEKTVLQRVFGDRVAGIEHIGSTSVPGLAAKPIIDIIMAVDSFSELAMFIETLQKLGYEYMPDRMFTDRKFFPKGPQGKRTHHLNIVLKNDPEQWAKPLAFRDYLRNNQAARDEYAHIKEVLAQQYANDRQAYTAAKSQFIRAVLRKVA